MLVLPKHPKLLRQRFSRVRFVLLGQKRLKKKLKHLSLFARISKIIFSLISVVSLLAALILISPAIYYQIFGADTVPVIAANQNNVQSGDLATGSNKQKISVPAFNPNLPTGSWLIIDRIGVRTQLIKSQDPEAALEKGVWWVPDFGVPGDNSKPIILAAHRYGFKWWWKDDYWKYNSFYYLPKLEPGDVVKIVYEQREWVYEIYAGEEGEEITDYQADLILYTCKHLNSPIRHFRYARLVEPY